MVQRLGAGHGIYNNRPRIVTAKKYSAMRIRRPPLILRIVVSLLRRAFINPVPASIKATETYQQASIAAAAIPINPVSNQLESESTRWLNIARKNRATFGLALENSGEIGYNSLQNAGRTAGPGKPGVGKRRRCFRYEAWILAARLGRGERWIRTASTIRGSRRHPGECASRPAGRVTNMQVPARETGRGLRRATGDSRRMS